jgi:hypothetical protein
VKLGLVLALASLCGCTLIDQRTFNPDADKAPVIAKPVAAPAPPPQIGPPPLLTIVPGATSAVYKTPLHDAVAAALARKPTVVFDVVEMIAPDTPGDAPLGAEAVAVARLIVGQGVPAPRVRLVARPDSTAPAHEVRVFVR